MGAWMIGIGSMFTRGTWFKNRWSMVGLGGLSPADFTDCADLLKGWDGA